MFDRLGLQLGAKFTLLLALVFLTGMVASWFALSQALQSKAEREVVSKAQILLKTMNSVRQYTSENINVHLRPLIDRRSQFIRETVPGFSARTVFEYFRGGKDYEDFLYKEATLDPTNPLDKADSFEASLVEGFRRNPTLPEQTGFREIDGRNMFFTARPIRIKSASCLECHSVPSAAPASMIEAYGSSGGFGWKMDEVIGSQIVYVPAQAVFSAGQQSAVLVTGIFVAIFALAALAITVFFRRAVVRPLSGLTAATQALSRGSPDSEPDASSPESGKIPETAARGDEIARLAEHFDFMTRKVYSREERLRQARAEVARSEAHFRSLIEYASDAVMVLDASLQVRYASPSLKRVLGFAPEDVVGKSPVQYVNEGDAATMQRVLETAAAAPGVGPTLEFRCAGGGVPKYLEATVANMLANPAVEGIVVNMRDVTERRRTEELTREKIRAEEQIRQLALYDSLTGLPNRHLYNEELSHAVARADRSDQALVTLSLDLDRFKRINDTFGREVGDLLLKEVANRLTKSLRQTDFVTRNDSNTASHHIARQGGNEFTVLLGDLSQAQEATNVARRILDALSQPFNLDGNEIVMSASIGIAVYRLDGNDADSLLKNADAAMHYAKDQGRNNYQYYNDKMNTSALQKMTLESNLHKALERDEFSLYYQPKIDVKSGSIVGAEALIRWRHPDLGLVFPAEFTPVPVAVNLSANQFHQENIAATVLRALQDHSVDPRLLELEITESTAMRNAEATSATLRSLKALGVCIAIDDFGTGYSSLSYLKRFPIDSLKIDRSFVTELPGNQDDATIVQAIITMSHALRLKVVAEGVENEAQLEFLTANGCDEIQGYYFSRPLPASQCTQLLRDKRKLPLPRVDDGGQEQPAETVAV